LFSSNFALGESSLETIKLKDLLSASQDIAGSISSRWINSKISGKKIENLYVFATLNSVAISNDFS